MARWSVISDTGDDAAIRKFIDEMDQLDTERDERLQRPEALMQAALWYVGQGVPVFPLQPRSKEPFPGSRGFKDATTDTGQVRHWWGQAPDANIGAPTGVLFDVIDIDGQAGFASLAQLREGGMILRPTFLAGGDDDAEVEEWVYATSYTPNRGGRHFFISANGDGCKPGFRDGIDYKGAGGYVVMPPSRGASGGRYDWIDTPRLHELGG